MADMTTVLLLSDSDENEWDSDEEGTELLRWEKPLTKSTVSKKNSAEQETKLNGGPKKLRFDVADKYEGEFQGETSPNNAKTVPLTPPVPQSQGGEHHQRGRGDSPRRADVRRGSDVRQGGFREEEFQYECGTLLGEVKEEQAMSGRRRSVVLALLTLCTVYCLLGLVYPVYYPALFLVHVQTNHHSPVYGCVLGAMALGAILSPMANRVLGQRWTLVAGSAGASLFVCARFTTSLPLLVVMGIVSGLTFTPAMVVLHVRVASLAVEFIQNGGGLHGNLLTLFHGLATGWYLSAPLLAGLLYLTLLPSTESGHSRISADLVTGETNRSSYHDNTLTCGPHYVWRGDEYSPHLTGLSGDEMTGRYYRVQATLGCFLLAGLGSVLLAAVAVRDGKPSEDQPSSVRDRLKTSHVTSVLDAGRQSFSLLLIPLIIFMGMQQLLGYGIFLEAYVTCEAGRRYSVLVTFLLAGVTLPVAVTAGYLSRWVGRTKWLLSAGVCHLTALLALTLWGHPGTWAFWLVATFWGLGDALWHTQLAALFSKLFFGSVDSVLANFYIWHTLGYVIVFAMTHFKLRTYVIMLVTLGMLGVSIVLYVILEIRLKLQERETKCTDANYTVLSEDTTWIPSFDPVQVRQDRTCALMTRIPGSKEDMVS